MRHYFVENRCDKTCQIRETQCLNVLIANLLYLLLFVVVFFFLVPVSQRHTYIYVLTITCGEKITIGKIVKLRS